MADVKIATNRDTAFVLLINSQSSLSYTALSLYFFTSSLILRMIRRSLVSSLHITWILCSISRIAEMPIPSYTVLKLPSHGGNTYFPKSSDTLLSIRLITSSPVDAI